jgi:phospholipid/cholesterol/gamma-HCH transport system permease protein
MISVLGKRFIENIKDFFYALGFFYQILKETLVFVKKKQVGFKVLVMQILFTGVEALPVIALISLGIGVVIIIQGITLLSSFGQGQLIYSILITIITRELGPLMAAFIIIARSATAIATELGNMVVSKEIEAFVSVGINPVSYLAVPRFLGVTISLILLSLYFNIFGLIGSFFVTQFIKPIPFIEYFTNLSRQLLPADILSSVIKSFSFGAIIATVATYNGFKVKVSSTEIPQVAIKAVTQSFSLIILADALITIIYYV